MVLKIYFADKPVFVCNELTPEMESWRRDPRTVLLNEASPDAIASLLEKVAGDDFQAGIVYGEDMVQMKNTFWKHFTIVQAAGGLVQNDSGDILMIFRRGKWDLPKGKLDDGETLKECAIREVQEETGLKNLVLKRHLLTTYHTYYESGEHILKESYWYLMHADKQESLVPQTEEDILQIEWVPASALHGKLENTFPSVMDVIQMVK